MDHILGRTAGRLATQLNSTLLSYSYYGHSAFSNFVARRPKILFQLHPHPTSVRRILNAELHRHPECAASLRQEWELALPEEDYQKLVAETKMAGAWIAASSFTKQTLVENGLSKNDIHVVPYGVDLRRFRPAECPTLHTGRLRLLFVGRINQRKGLKYLLEALRLLSTRQIELVICGRVLDDLSLLGPFRSQVTLRPSVTYEELLEAYQRAELFAFPSLVEGFGHVLLEALACGLPVLSTTQTAAPDLLTEGVDGFIIPPCRPDSLANRIEWALDNRRGLFAMKTDARLKAEQFTWERFRSRVGQIVTQCCANAT
jgi:glycosyltransferase involved in cell wall biosynthesis